MLLLFCNLIANIQTTLFWASAIVGTTLFCLRMFMMFVGGVVETLDSGHDDYSDHDSDSNSSFKILTLHSLSGFLMMFGWTGLACSQQWHMSSVASWLVATATGFAVMLLTALIFHVSRRFESAGSAFDINQAINCVGSVYQHIPAYGQGKVHIVIQGVTRELLAQSADKRNIDSFATVKVVAVIDHETVEVILIK